MFILGVSPSVMKIPDFVEQKAFHNGTKQSQEEKGQLACDFKHPGTHLFKALMIFGAFVILC